MMRYCKRCVMPDTKPDLHLDEEGVCNACRSFERRTEVDWQARRVELDEILARYRSKDKKRWDCIVPVSGGKDSGVFVSYTVKHGDTLTKIAHHYKTTVSSICRHNSIIKDRNFIVSGWVLKVPDNR